MRFISPRLHGILDYGVAAALIAAPLLLDFASISAAASAVSIAAGIGLLVYSLLTDYALGLRSLISFRAHLLLDAVAGVALIAAPFVLGFGGIAAVFYWAVGAADLAVGALTRVGSDVACQPGASSAAA